MTSKLLPLLLSLGFLFALSSCHEDVDMEENTKRLCYNPGEMMGHITINGKNLPKEELEEDWVYNYDNNGPRAFFELNSTSGFDGEARVGQKKVVTLHRLPTTGISHLLLQVQYADEVWRIDFDDLKSVTLSQAVPAHTFEFTPAPELAGCQVNFSLKTVDEDGNQSKASHSNTYNVTALGLTDEFPYPSIVGKKWKLDKIYKQVSFLPFIEFTSGAALTYVGERQETYTCGSNFARISRDISYSFKDAYLELKPGGEIDHSITSTLKKGSVSVPECNTTVPTENETATAKSPPEARWSYNPKQNFIRLSNFERIYSDPDRYYYITSYSESSFVLQSFIGEKRYYSLDQ